MPDPQWKFAADPVDADSIVTQLRADGQQLLAQVAADRQQPSYLDRMDRLSDELAARGHWAGLPVPVEDHAVNVAPGYSHQSLAGSYFDSAGKLHRQHDRVAADHAGGDGAAVTAAVVVRNRWTCRRRGVEVLVIQRPDGTVGHQAQPTSPRRLHKLLATLNVGWQAWQARAELRARQELARLVSRAQLANYVLTDAFWEKSRRSGVIYLFRKLRPTLAFATQAGDATHMRYLTALCLHQLGYYQGTFAGAMVPTDDVIAHLLLMRACEHRFWAKANHHNLDDERAGV